MWLVECTPKTRNTSAERWIVKQVELAKQVTSWWDKRCMTVESGFLDTGKKQLCQSALPSKYIPFPAVKSTADQRCWNKWCLANLVSGGGCKEEARVSSGQELAQHCSRPQASLSSIDPPEGTHPPSHPPSPTPHHRWIEGFSSPIVTHPTSLQIFSPQLTQLHSSVAVGMCAKGQSTVWWFWLWPPNPPSCPDRLCCPEVSRNGRSMWLKSGQLPKYLRSFKNSKMSQHHCTKKLHSFNTLIP